ncbi:MAG: hypothetical protein ACYTF1_14220, partial [Planctomycetota bacterium]
MLTIVSGLIPKKTGLLVSGLVFVTALMPLLFFNAEASACDYYCLRDAAYDRPRDIHRLCVFGKQNDPEAEKIHKVL